VAPLPWNVLLTGAGVLIAALIAFAAGSPNLALLIVAGALVFALMVRQQANRPELYCPHCRTVGLPRLARKGSAAMQFALLVVFGLVAIVAFAFVPLLFFFLIPVLLVAFAAPSILYLVWRQTGRNEICPSCGQPGMIPPDSPRAIELRKGQ
jgi:hypothetical protein